MRQPADPPARPCCRDQTWASRASVQKKNKQKLNGKIILSQIAVMRFLFRKGSDAFPYAELDIGRKGPGSGRNERPESAVIISHRCPTIEGLERWIPYKRPVVTQKLKEDLKMKNSTIKTLPLALAAAAILATMAGPVSAQSSNVNTTIQEGRINTNDTYQIGSLNDNATYQEGRDNANRSRQMGDQNWNQSGQFGRYNYNETHQYGFANRTQLTRGRGRN